jgi:hypothetical protein
VAEQDKDAHPKGNITFTCQHWRPINIADGGIVDWVQQLTGNKKLRTIISGVGLELAQKLMNPCGMPANKS